MVQQNAPRQPQIPSVPVAPRQWQQAQIRKFSDGKPRGCEYLNYTHLERYWTHLQKLKFQSQSLYQGYRKGGFRVFDHRGKKTEGDTEVEVV
jgi:hypothetical protein